MIITIISIFPYDSQLYMFLLMRNHMKMKKIEVPGKMLIYFEVNVAGGFLL